jgi:peptidoglycan/xylan/chitin deacetylase (PgdA/CDA1 family)
MAAYSRASFNGKPAPRAAKLASRVFLRLHALRERLARVPPSIPILTYHRVSELQPDHYMTILPDRFEAILRAVQRHYTFVSLAEIDELLKKERLDAPVIGLTFDDSYGCNATYAVPILKALRVPTTFFVSSAYVDTDDLMLEDVRRGYSGLRNFTSAELREMAETDLFDVQSHTVSHIDLSRTWDDATVERELGESKRALERITGRPVTRLAIPFGSLAHCSAQAICIARSVGYERVYSFFGGRNRLTPGSEPSFVLQRIGPVYEDCDFVRACVENYRGRRTRILFVGRGPRLPADFHATCF